MIKNKPLSDNCFAIISDSVNNIFAKIKVTNFNLLKLTIQVNYA